jgi:predicted O-methyltransferase YrrM
MVLRQVFGRNEYAIGDRQLEERIWTRYSDIVKARQTAVVVDAGANIGLASLWFANQYPKAKIVCIEPDPENFRILKENLAASDLRSIQPEISVLHGRLTDAMGTSSNDTRTMFNC